MNCQPSALTRARTIVIHQKRTSHVRTGPPVRATPVQRFVRQHAQAHPTPSRTATSATHLALAGGIAQPRNVLRNPWGELPSHRYSFSHLAA